MLENLIILLGFGSISYLAYKGIPYLVGIYYKSQQGRMEKVAKQLDQMFVFSERQRVLMIFMATPLCLAALGFIFTRHPIGLAVGLALGLIAPKMIIKQMYLLRQDRFHNQLVDGLMLLSSSLRAGLSLNQAFEVLADEMPAPLSEEFALVIKENKMGVSFEDCLLHLKKRMPLEDIELIVTAVNIARETGGNLTEIFEQLVTTMRDKKKLEDRVRTLTVQGRLQGYIMMILPVAFAAFVHQVNPENINILLNDKMGQMLLYWAFISEGIGIVLIRKFSKVEV